MPEDPQRWPPCLRLAGIPPAALVREAPDKKAFESFLQHLHWMLTVLLRHRKVHDEGSERPLFQDSRREPQGYPWGELLGPLSRPEPQGGGAIAVRRMPTREWGWEMVQALDKHCLLFSDDDIIDLKQWVLNTEAHPLPIHGFNSLYRPHAT